MTKDDEIDPTKITIEMLKMIGHSDEEIDKILLEFKERDALVEKYRRSKLHYYEKKIPEYEECLKKAKREEDVQVFLTENLQLALDAFSDGSHPLDIVPKFKLGQDLVTDFVVIGVRSHGKPYHLIFVELESPTGKPFTKNNVYSRELNIAIKQMNEWRHWLKDKFETFCADFPEKLHKEISPTLRDDIRSAIKTYKIVIGRRNSYTEKDRELRGSFFDSTNGSIEIMSYDNIGDFGKRYLEFDAWDLKLPNKKNNLATN